MESFIEKAGEFFASPALMSEVGFSILDTLYMTVVSTLMAYVIGLPLGLLLVVTAKNGIKPMVWLNRILGFIVNFLRSVPFIILIIWVFPVTRVILGKTTGSPATLIVPLVISAFPFVARIVEQSANEIDRGVIEAAQSMGASNWQIVTRVIIRETKPSLIVGAAITLTTIIGYTTMGTVIASGGIGALGITYGHYRFNRFILTLAVVVLVIMVQLFQSIGMKLAKKFDKRYR